MALTTEEGPSVAQQCIASGEGEVGAEARVPQQSHGQFGYSLPKLILHSHVE